MKPLIRQHVLPVRRLRRISAKADKADPSPEEIATPGLDHFSKAAVEERIATALRRAGR